MILGEIKQTVGIATTLDDLFRRAGVRHPDAPALIDPPNRGSFTDGAPRALTYAQADHAISAFAARMRRLGLQADAVVAIQLPNTIDSIIAFLGVLRAGMIAAPVPLLWRRRELVDALGRVGAKAIVTCARSGNAAHAEFAMHTAAALFPIRHVCSFGRNLPDGIVSMEDIFGSGSPDTSATLVRSEAAPAHIAAVTFGVDGRGILPVARNHIEIISGGLAVYLASGIAAEATLLSTIPFCTFAGMALTVVPWLLSGGTLHLHHGFDPAAFAAQRGATKYDVVVLPAQAMQALSDSGAFIDEACTVVALWRAPERLKGTKAVEGGIAVVDVSSFGEIGIVTARRNPQGGPIPLAHGVISVPRGAIGAMTVVETARNDAGTLMLRGPMVPAAAFPPGSAHGHTLHFKADPAGYIDTGFGCRLDAQSQTLAITVAPAGIFGVGGYYLRQSDVDACVAKASPDAAVVPLPDRNLGNRLAGAGYDRNAVAAALETQGANALISSAFSRGSADEAA
jgi:hypothetical protein